MQRTIGGHWRGKGPRRDRVQPGGAVCDRQGRAAGRWTGENVIVCASGPSLTQEDVEAFRGRARVIVVNATYKIAPWADVCYGADHPFWRVYFPDMVHRFKGELWTVSEGARDEFGLYWIRLGRLQGFTDEPDTINGGGNSGYQAIHLAATFGARRIVLLGFDMQRTGGKTHWHGNHIGGLRNGAGFVIWMRQLRYLAADLKKRGVEVINATRTTALTCFPKMTVEGALALCDRTQDGKER